MIRFNELRSLVNFTYVYICVAYHKRRIFRGFKVDLVTLARAALFGCLERASCRYRPYGVCVVAIGKKLLYCDGWFSRASGTGSILSLDPASELAGYYRASLWDSWIVRILSRHCRAGLSHPAASRLVRIEPVQSRRGYFFNQPWNSSHSANLSIQ